MYSPNEQRFLEKAAQGNLVPVWREIVADQETPVSAYERLRGALRSEVGDSVFTYLLESVEGGENVARYSFLGGEPRAVIRSVGKDVEIVHRDGRVETMERQDALSVVREHMVQYKPVPDPALPPFFGGAVGYLGYDMIPQFEPRVGLSEGEGLDWPEMLFMISDTLVVFDRARQTMKVVANAFIEGDARAAYRDAVERVDGICRHLTSPRPHHLLDVTDDVNEPPVTSSMTQEQFETAVDTAKEYIRAGDVIQVVLSQRFQVDCEADSLDVYRALRFVNPSPYMFALDFGPYRMIGSSPEIHVRCEEGEVEIRPIAGTRPRSPDKVEDQRLEQELKNDPKECAEHVMLVDLGRNDIGRVCTYGTVEVPDLMIIERYSHVMHIVSSVFGKLDPSHDVYDLMAATFPAGTVSGAPKIRAMEIIADLEPIKRGPYSGAVAYFGFTGNLDSCITIRTVLLHDGKAYVQAGAGIVADSVPANEFEETRNKACGMIKAVEIAKRYAAARDGEASS